MATEDKESAKDTVENQIKTLKEALSSPMGYLSLLIECEGEQILDTDPFEILTQYQVWTITQMLQSLLCALQLALLVLNASKLVTINKKQGRDQMEKPSQFPKMMVNVL